MTETLKTVRYALVFATICVVGFIMYSIFKSAPAEKKVSINIEALRLVKCQEIVVAKGTAKVKAGITENQKIAGFALPSFMPGSKSVGYDGPVVMRFGYDSSMPLFPANTRFFTEGDGYRIVIDQIPCPKVLSDPSVKGYVHESKSYFTGDIPSQEFYQYLDSLVAVAGMNTIRGNPNYFRDAYASMAFEIVRSIIGKDAKFTLTIGDLTINEMSGLKRPGEEQNFIENIKSFKER